MEPKIGDNVKFINESLEGKIISILSDKKLLIAANDGFNREVSINEIIVIKGDKTYLYNTHIEQKLEQYNELKSIKNQPTKNILSKYKDLSKYKYEGILEIDLHLEELVEFPLKLENWQRLYTQLNHVKKCLNVAIEEKNITKIIFIHGKGKGVLKTEIINLISDYDKITYKDADFREYGSGAIEVIIRK